MGIAHRSPSFVPGFPATDDRDRDRDRRGRRTQDCLGHAPEQESLVRRTSPRSYNHEDDPGPVSGGKRSDRVGRRDGRRKNTQIGRIASRSLLDHQYRNVDRPEDGRGDATEKLTFEIRPAM